MGDRNPRFHMFMNLKQNKEKIDLILKSKYVTNFRPEVYELHRTTSILGLENHEYIV